MSETTAAPPSSSSFHFSPSLPSAHDQPHSRSPPLASPVSPTASTNSLPPSASNASTASTTPHSDAPTALFERSSSSISGTSSATRPVPPARSTSLKTENDIWGSSFSGSAGSLSGSSSGGGGMGMGGTAGAVGEPAIQRTARAASDGLILSSALGGASMAAAAANTAGLSPTGRLSSLGSDDSSEEQALFREHQRRSLEHSANARLVNSVHNSTMTTATSTSSTTSGSSRAFGSATSPTLASAATSPFFAPMTTVSSNSSSAILPPLLSPTSQSPPTSAQLPPFSSANGTDADPKGATLHLGDLDVWMDEQYVRECCKRMGWDSVVSVKMSRGASPSSGYCFLTFPSPAEAARVLNRFNASPPMLMPRSGRTFKLNWGTGVPGSVPRWEGEWSVFVGDLAREVGEQDLMALFAPLFPSTKSAKVMSDPSSGLSRGYGFVRFGEESDMHRALLLGANPNSGLLLHGRTIRISEASGGANGAVEGLAPHLRERTRTRTGSEIGAAAGAGAAGYFPPYPPPPLPPHSPHDHFAPNPVMFPGPGPNGEHYISPTYPAPFSPSLPLSPTAHSHFGGGGGSNGPLSPTLGGRGPLSSGGGPVRAPIPPGSVPQGGDPNNTTVFVGGLPACISEETLKSFFHHFGEITYCKIPTGKGCGFVQFIRRQDAELAIAKMNDFPIHGKSRIRLSWGRSQGDKQVEHVRKLASALGVPFDAVWRMVQGQDNSTIKQIASAVGGGGGAANSAQRDVHSPQLQQQQLNGGLGGAGRMDLRAVANAAGLTESEVLDLVKAGNGLGGLSSNSGSAAAAASNSNSSGAGASSTAATSNNGTGELLVDRNGNGEKAGGAGPYARVSPSSFSAQQQHPMLPLSPPPSAGPAGSSFAHHQSQLPPPAAHAHGFHHHPYAAPHSHSPAPFHPPPPHHAFPPPHSHQHSHSQQQQQQQHSHHPSPSPYNAIRPESYVVLSPNASPYERVDFAEGGRPTPPLLNGGSGPGNDRSGYPHPQQGPFGAARAGAYEQPHAQPFPDGGANYTTSPPPPQSGANGLEDSFAGLNFGPAPSLSQPPRTLPPPPQRMSFSSASGGGIASPNAPDFFPSALGSPTTTKFEAPEGRWSWNEVGTGSA